MALADPIGGIDGVRRRPSGISVGQMRVPLGVFGMIYESRPNVTVEAASLAIKRQCRDSAGGSKPFTATGRWPHWSRRPCRPPDCQPTPCNWCPRPTAPPSAP